MDSKFYVSFEIAKLLNKKGYDKVIEDFDFVYLKDGSLSPRIFLHTSPFIPAPTKSEAIHWIECDYYFRISVIYVDEGLYEYEIYDLNSGERTSGYASSRLDAEDEVIIRSLELISSLPDNGV